MSGLKKKIKIEFDVCRGGLLSLCEQAMGDQSNWSFVRQQILKMLSDQRGLEAKVTEIILDGMVRDEFQD